LPAEGKAAMDGGGRAKPRPGVRQQDVAERKANPVVPEYVLSFYEVL